MTSSLGKHLASYPCTAAGSRALAAHLRDDHGKAVYTSPYEDHAAHSAMHAAAHPATRRALTAWTGPAHKATLQVRDDDRSQLVTGAPACRPSTSPLVRLLAVACGRFENRV